MGEVRWDRDEGLPLLMTLDEWSNQKGGAVQATRRRSMHKVNTES
jgi:hypothetical protein